MTPKLPVVRATQLLRALHRDGWYEDEQEGSHLALRHPTKRGKVTVPIHGGNDLKTKTLHEILKQAQITAAQFRRLL